MRIFVGNLSFQMSQEELLALFSAESGVASADIITDRENNRSRGFGFVDMPDADEAKKAMASLNGRDVGGRTLIVTEAEERRQHGDDQGKNRRPPSHRDRY